MGDRQCPGGLLARAFDKWNMLPGLPSFLRAMTLFNQHGLETLQFCALPCNHVSEHEAIILGLMCSLRNARPEMVRGTLGLLVEEEAVGDLLLSLSALGRSMDQAGIYPERLRQIPAPKATNPKNPGN